MNFSDLNKLNEGMGEKIGMFTYLVFSFVFSVAVAFLHGWKLTLVVMTSMPVIIICAALVAKVIIDLYHSIYILIITLQFLL